MEGGKKHVSKALFYKSQKIPQNLRKWLKIPNKFGSVITYPQKTETGEVQNAPLKLIAFKCPMGDHYDNVIIPSKRLYPEDIYGYYFRQDIVLKHIFDFSHTTKYYDPAAFAVLGVQHHKLQIEGLKAPDESLVEQFIEKVKELELTLLPNEYIGVHCTHGKNRTGYMIINYMCREKGVSLDEAMAAFEASRHPLKIDKEHLLLDLRKRYGPKE